MTFHIYELAYEIRSSHINKIVDEALQRHPRLPTRYRRPVSASDRLYQSSVIHNNLDEACETTCGDDLSLRVVRPQRIVEDSPAIHYGKIAPSSCALRDAAVRDNLGAENDILCFEMEASGLCNTFPCLFIRGVCDYADSHPRANWNGYASMVAAAYTKELLCQIPSMKIEAERRVSDILQGRPQALHFHNKSQSNTSAYRLHRGENRNWWYDKDFQPKKLGL